VHNDNDNGARQRFATKVCLLDCGCHRWLAQVTDKGYGIFSFRGEPWKAHRVAWVLAGRDLAPYARLENLCHHRWCVNPDHWQVWESLGTFSAVMTWPRD
jgi:hypothetical protein